MKKHFIILACTFMCISSAQAQDLLGRWDIDSDTVVSFEACKKKPNKICGYIKQFESSGRKRLDKKLCNAGLIGGLVKKGEAYKQGWYYDLEDEDFYKLSIYPKDNGSIQLKFFVEEEGDGVDQVWKKSTRSKHADCKK